MTISTEPAALSYDGDDSTASFPITWKYFAKSHVVATLRASNGNETTWVLGTQYTLSDAGVASGGTLTVNVAPVDYTPATGETLVLELAPPNTQDSSLPLGGPFPSSTVEDELDEAAQRDANLQRLINRSLRVPKTDTQTGSLLDLPIDSDRASTFLAFDANGAPISAAGTSADLTPVSTYMDSLLDDADFETAIGTLGLVPHYSVGSVTGTNTVAGTTPLTVTAYVAGQLFTFVPANDNTGAVTLNVDSLGAGALQLNGAALKAGSLQSGVPATVRATNNTPVFELIGNGAGLRDAPPGVVQTVSGNTTVGIGNNKDVYNCSGTMTLTLPTAASATDGWSISGVNTGTADVLLDADGTETINGQLTWSLQPNGGFTVTSNGSAWTATFHNNGRVGQVESNFDGSIPGWLLLRGQTMGSAASGATEAAEIYKQLYVWLWDNLADGQAAVSTGRGASGAADFDADKTLTLPDMRGRAPVGKDNMGGSSANVVADTEADTMGDVSGEDLHTMTSGEMVAHSHGQSTSSGAGGATTGTATVSGTTQFTFNTQSSGSTTPFNVMAPYMTFNVFIRY
jgi:hypothetical protein